MREVGSSQTYDWSNQSLSPPALWVPRQPEKRRVWSMDSVLWRCGSINGGNPLHRIRPAKERGGTRRGSGRCLCQCKADKT